MLFGGATLLSTRPALAKKKKQDAPAQATDEATPGEKAEKPEKSAEQAGDALCELWRAGGRVMQAVEFRGETVEVVDGFRPLRAAHRRKIGVPVRRDHEDRLGTAQQCPEPAQEIVRGALLERHRRRAVGHEDSGLSFHKRSWWLVAGR